jgi:hypothetical protein
VRRSGGEQEGISNRYDPSVMLVQYSATSLVRPRRRRASAHAEGGELILLLIAKRRGRDCA